MTPATETAARALLALAGERRHALARAAQAGALGACALCWTGLAIEHGSHLAAWLALLSAVAAAVAWQDARDWLAQTAADDRAAALARLAARRPPAP